MMAGGFVSGISPGILMVHLTWYLPRRQLPSERHPGELENETEIWLIFVAATSVRTYLGSHATVLCFGGGGGGGGG